VVVYSAPGFVGVRLEGGFTAGWGHRFRHRGSDREPPHLDLVLPGLHDRAALGSVDRPNRVTRRQLTDLHAGPREPLQALAREQPEPVCETSSRPCWKTSRKAASLVLSSTTYSRVGVRK